MKISTTGSAAMRIKRVVRIQDGPVVPMAYSLSGRQFRVEWIQVEYKWDGDRWAVDSSFGVDLGGYVLKKDGEPSKNWHVSNPDWDYKTKTFAERYEFVQKVVDLLRPDGELAMSVFLEHEVDA